MQHSPRFALLDADFDNNAYMPIIPENTLPWDLQALPTLAISRFTKLTPASGYLKLYRDETQPEEASVGDLQTALFGSLADRIGTLQFSARYVTSSVNFERRQMLNVCCLQLSFGNLLRINPGASLDMLDQSVNQTWSSQADDVFIPA